MREARALTALDWVGVALTALVTIALLAFPFVVTPSFAEMFREFGNTELPVITRLALAPWPGVVLGLVVGATTVTAVATSGWALGVRRALIATAFLSGALALATLIYAMYAPIFALSGNIKGD